MSSQDILVRRFRPEDYDKIISLWTNADLPARPKGRDSVKGISRQVGDGNTILLVAELNGGIVGAVLGTHDGRKGWIGRLAVDAKFRRKNIATRLVSEAERWFEESGLEVFACLIEGYNATSMELFKRLGYEEERDARYFTKRKSGES